MHNILNYLQANWFLILSAFIIIEQAVKAEAEKRQNVKLISICDHIGTILGYIMDILTMLIKKTPKPPAAAIFALIFFATMLQVAHADTSSTSNTPAISITQTISGAVQSVNVPVDIAKIQSSGLAVNTGLFYDWKAKAVEATYTYPVFGAMNIDNWASWDYVNFGYASPDVLIAGTGLVINVGVVVQKWGIKNIPANVQTILNSASIGLTPMVGIREVGGKNQVTGGPGGYVKITF